MTTIEDALGARLSAAGFGGSVLAQGQPGYDEARQVWNGTVSTKPALIAQCASTADVVAAVALARDAGVPLAVRGGGHSVAGLSSCEGGVVVDLSRMRAVTVNPDTRTALVEPGATWADLDTAAGAHGLATTGGLISTTGVAGLTLGGGIGSLQRKHGLACDNLRAAEVVTASGEVVEADDALLWGLRGGGGNFGVVTRMTFDLHPVSIVLGGLMMFPLSRGDEVLRAFRDWAVDAPDEIAMMVAINTAPPVPFVPPELVGQKVVAFVGCWCGDHDEGNEALAPLRALGPAVDLFGPMPYVALQSMLDAGAPSGMRYYFKGGYAEELDDEVIAVALEHGERMASPMSQLHFHQMGGAVARLGASSSYPGRAAGWTYNLIGAWADPAEDDVHVAGVRAVFEALRPHSMTATYVNFDGDAKADAARSAYGDDIYDRLARLKREYDPHNLFQRNQNVRPAS